MLILEQLKSSLKKYFPKNVDIKNHSNNCSRDVLMFEYVNSKDTFSLSVNIFVKTNCKRNDVWYKCIILGIGGLIKF